MASPVEISNMSLRHLGISKEIANFTERSQEAGACNRFYSTAVENTLRAYAWPFATANVALGLLEEDPTSEWKYSYAYPTDCLDFRRILSGTRNDTRQSREPYRIAYGVSSTVIYTDRQDAEAEYTVRVDDSGRFPVDFTLAVSYMLASLIATSLTAGDPFKLTDKCIKLFQYQIGQAGSKAFNEEQPEEDPRSEQERARD